MPGSQMSSTMTSNAAPHRLVEARFAALGALDVVPLVTEHAHEGAADTGFVVDDQDRGNQLSGWQSDKE